ncbi:MAG: MaoC family dehydratase N-terminal domain-containing protein [Burkholderiaceae bacterium]
MNSEPNRWQQWIGREEQRVDCVTAAPIAALSATLDRDDPAPRAGDTVPPLAHWLYFTPIARTSEMGPDGHPTRGGFLPPALPRRMWAGGRLQFQSPLRVGDEVTRHSRITDITVKQGRSGALVFVTVAHAIATARGAALTEEHDIVYRDLPPPTATSAAAPSAPSDEAFAREILPDPVLLFRYSALTFNGHRIHYDRRYVTEVEGYPGLVVHGPLIATLLLDLLRRQHPDAKVQRFDFKAVAPLFDTHRFSVCGKPESGRRFSLWARNHEGALAMLASAEVA